ncbi:uncharacterized protein EI90DRAFT_1613500 [Cantharellus anzutake]|uniref:uncharacterized protein n=1 Tax=Cantharellus anzutake TaxID=1750568 RepID=UPI001908E3C2|nr:uncharacterized protein EI90DRAFT_1613500 [Cantharellus anzutake]KAF8328206.1 hypothetical protein EI90DRAFT_1613500 [Cantharellus anzutake]
MAPVQFTPFASTVSPAFWHTLTKVKLEVQKLSSDVLPIVASYKAGRTFRDRETGVDVSLPSDLSLAEDAFDPPDQARSGRGAAISRGYFKNFNTIEEFKAADKQLLFNNLCGEIWEAFKDPNADPSEFLTRFLLITFADLKKYKFYYWFAFPAFVSKPPWDIEEDGWKLASEEFGTSGLESISAGLASKKSISAFFLAKKLKGTDNYEVESLKNLASFFEGVSPSERIIGFLDPSSQVQNPGWPLRNLLAYLTWVAQALGSAHDKPSYSILCWRDLEVPRQGQHWKSRIGLVHIQGPSPELSSRPTAVGWEKNQSGKLAPRFVDLSPIMEPTNLAEQAVDLNLKLMRWRLLPSLNLEKISSTKCLLLGAGTLGCFVARALLAWGVRKISLVDYGRVSFSNPVRQPLFEFADCLDGGKPKAEAAAAALKRIFPGVDATGHMLSIPMPGHPVPSSTSSLVEQCKADVARLEKLVDEHDVIFLLMDSRESRWLPTLVGKSKNKIVINAALGFDSFVVMRHGARELGGNSPKLGCYFCNDIVAPTDSLTDRTLDQMCTVTRPGLASIASSNSVELLVSLLQHPAGNGAPAPPPPSTGGSGNEESVLGLVPHQLRGSLAHFTHNLITGTSYERCTACSNIVIEEYERKGFDMLIEAFNDTKYLERLTGLDKLKEETDAVLDDVEWASDDED